ncbi:MAG: hypothetical protein U1F66_00465 [bacterium]
MSCRRISPVQEIASALGGAGPSLNAMPTPLGPATGAKSDYFVCDAAGDRPEAPGKLVAFAAPAGGAGALAKSTLLFSPIAAAKPALPPPPDSPLARLLYDLTTQLEDFELSTNLKLPMEGIGPGTVQTFSKALIKGQGALVELGIEFRPFAGPQPLLKPLDQVPILGPFFIVRVLKVEMDPGSRKLQAKVKYLWFPITKQVHEDYLKKAELPQALVQGPGYDLKQGVPLYSWQILDLVLKILEAKGTQVAKNVGVDQVKPLLEKSELKIEGNFSNKKLKVSGLELEFGPLGPGETHRITVTGSLLDPVLRLHGLKAARLEGRGGSLRLANAGERLEPLEVQIHVDPLGKAGPRFEVKRYQSQKVEIEVQPNSGGEPLRLTMEEGLELNGLKFFPSPEGPQLEIQGLSAKQVRLQGLGIQLKTKPGDAANFEAIRMRLAQGRPEFEAKLKAKATGELTVSRAGSELGFLKFQSLEADGSFALGHESDGSLRLEVAGRLRSEIPELRFLVRSEKLHASAQTRVEQAEVSGLGRIRIWPELLRTSLEAQAGGPPVTVKGRGGLVSFHQDAAEVEGWPELKKELGEAAAKQVVTDFFIQPKEIEFGIEKMDLGRFLPNTGGPSLEISEADLGPIRIRGEVWGKLFARLPGGVYFPVQIPEAAKMTDAKVEIKRLQDKGGASLKREVIFQEIVLAGEESQPTLSKKDQKRCGFDRQHFHAALGLFQFSPEERSLQVQKLDPHFHLYLKNWVGGGCLKID